MLVVWLGIGIIIMIAISMLVQSYRYTINEKTIYFSNLPTVYAGTKIVFISDIHRRKLTKRILKRIQVYRPVDYVFIGGDLVEKDVPQEQVQENIKMLRSIAPTYFVWGNHDLKYDVARLASMLHEEGVQILENEAVLLRHDYANKLWLIGIGDVCSKKDRLDKALQSTVNEGGFRILLAHVPTITKKITQEQQVALVLSGHTHGGQICLPWIGPITGAVGELFPKQVVGYHDLGFTKLFITSGYGTSHFPLRLFTTPEIVIITLQRSEVDD